jgi:hypothetical protein
MARSKSLVKVALLVAVAAGLGFLFIRSAQSTRSEPYTIGRELLRNWTVAFEPASSATAPALVLRPQPELGSSLFRQVFSRTMESLSGPTTPAIPLVLKGEFDRAFAGKITPEALVAAAQNAGLDSGTFVPRCLAYRRVSEPGTTRQLYFVLFDAPVFERFREQIASLPDGRVPTDTFDPAALSPVLFIGASDSAFNRWLPLRADQSTDCLAPITVGT